MSKLGTNKIRIVGLVIVIAVIILAIIFSPSSQTFNQDTFENISKLLGYLLLMSLLVERVIEVFLSAWRSTGADELDRVLGNTRNALQTAQIAARKDNAKISTLDTELEQLSKERVSYSARSRSIAQWMGIVIGVCVSFVGVRILASLVETPADEGIRAIFIAIDIIFTAAVLAGGSEAINKITKIYNSFMLKTESKIKASPNNNLNPQGDA